MLLIILIVLALLFFGGGSLYQSQPGVYPYRTHGVGLGTLLLIVLLVLFLTGNLGSMHLR